MDDSATLLHWIEVVGPILFSWPLVILIAMACFRQPLFRILENFSESNINNAKIGPLELREDGENQDKYSKNLQFLVSGFVTDHELDHLQKLNGSEPFHFEKTPYFTAELERLCSLGVIHLQGAVEDLPANGDLKERVEITEQGKQYLEMRTELVGSKE